MDLDAFSDQLMAAAEKISVFLRIDIETNDAAAKGRGQISDEMFLRFYFNHHTGTIVFALIRNRERVWGVDFDNLIGWHRHPLSEVEQHEPTEPMTVAEIMQELNEALKQIG